VFLLSATNFIFVASEALALYEEGLYVADTETTNEEAEETKTEEEEDNTVKSRINVSLDKTTLSALNDQNQITLKITLLTNDSTKDLLYKNAKFTIALPDNVKFAADKKVSGHLTATNGFTDMKVNIDKETNKKVTITLYGEQTNYTSEINAQLTVDMVLDIDSTVPSSTSAFQITYENENDVDESNNVIVRTATTDMVSIYTGYGIVTSLQATNYDGNGGTVQSGTIYGGTAEATINMNEENSKDVAVTGSVVNNSTGEIEVKSIEVNTVLTNYNNNDSVLKSDNIDISSLAGSLSSGKSFSFNTGFTIPEYLYYNEKITISYLLTYIDNGNEYKAETTIVLKTEEKDVVGDVFISDDRTMRVEIAKVQGDGTLIDDSSNVKEGSTIRYIVTVANLTKNNIENVSAIMTRENNNSKFYDYAQYGETGSGILGETLFVKTELEDVSKTASIGTISAGKDGTAKYEVVVANDSDVKELLNKLEIKVGDNKVLFSNLDYIETSKTQIEDAKLKVNFQYAVPQSTEQLENVIPQIQSGESLVSTLLTITNISNENAENINVELDFSKYSCIKDVYFYGEEELEYSYSNGIFKFTIPSIEAGKQHIANIHIDFNSIDTAKEDIALSASVTENGTKYLSNELDLSVIDVSVKTETSISSNVENNASIENGSNLEYTVTITNVGNTVAGVRIYNSIASTYELIDFLVNNESKKDTLEEGKVSYISEIPVGGTITAKIIIKVDTDAIVASNELIVETIGQDSQIYQYMYEIAHTDIVSDDDDENPMEPTDKIDTDNTNNSDLITKPSDEDGTVDENGSADENTSGNINSDGTSSNDSTSEETKTYSISGTAWLDANNNGTIDTDEKLLSNVKVMLVDVDNQNAYVKDSSGNNLEYTTGDNGEYKFTNLPKGNYYVIFNYDTTTYELASSNVIAKEYTKLDGSVCAITSDIQLNSNQQNVNLGLVFLPEFDLKIENYITKTIVQNTAGTTTTEFTNSKLAKIEIPSKVLSGSTVLIEYTIKITNNGDLAGNIQEITDYLPDNVKFNSELNSDWYIGTDGNIYNNSLANTTIASGETKTLTLVLTKNMTTSNVGTTKNTVEITKYTNSRELKDVNTSDNKDYAEIVIGIKTGDVVMYITLVILSIIIIAGGVYFIKKKIL
jgi:uncharacterized repeat protein (TIGR01451 family)